jgi:hypothetical protein
MIGRVNGNLQLERISPEDGSHQEGSGGLKTGLNEQPKFTTLWHQSSATIRRRCHQEDIQGISSHDILGSSDCRQEG